MKRVSTPNQPIPADDHVKTPPPNKRVFFPSFLATAVGDEQLVLSAQHGDQAAFNTLIRHHRDNAYKLAFKILYKPNGRIDASQSAEDVLQEASLRAWKNIKDVDPTRFGAWFRSIVRNECKQLFRDLAKDFENIDIYADIESIEDYGNWMISANPPPFREARYGIAKEREKTAQEYREYQEAVGLLPNRQRQVMTLRGKEYTYKEIAQELDMPISTVKAHIHKARRNIKKLTKKEDFAESGKQNV